MSKSAQRFGHCDSFTILSSALHAAPRERHATPHFFANDLVASWVTRDKIAAYKPSVHFSIADADQVEDRAFASHKRKFGDHVMSNADSSGHLQYDQ